VTISWLREGYQSHTLLVSWHYMHLYCSDDFVDGLRYFALPLVRRLGEQLQLDPYLRCDGLLRVLDALLGEHRSELVQIFKANFDAITY